MQSTSQVLMVNHLFNLLNMYNLNLNRKLSYLNNSIDGWLMAYFFLQIVSVSMKRGGLYLVQALSSIIAGYFLQHP